MKINKIIFAVLSALIGFVVFQSCTKDNTTFKSYGSFLEPTATAPLDATLVSVTGTTLDLKWATTDSDGDTPKCDVYFGTSPVPPLYKKGHNALTLNVPVVQGGTYYWQVVMIDANNVTTTSPVFSFTVAVVYDINKYVGVYDCNEPGYGHYNCNFTKVSSTTVQSDNFWDSGWAVNYVLDAYGTVTLTPVSYTSGGVTYDITGSGTFNNTTFGLVVHYVVKNHATGAVVDDNTHTFVHK